MRMKPAMSPAFAQDEPSTIDLTFINTAADDYDAFQGVQNLIVDGPPRVLFDRIASHIKTQCYKIISLSIGGPIHYRATCVALISTALSRTEMRRRGFEWHGLSEASAREPLPLSERSFLKARVHSDTSTEIVRMDFVNGCWKS